MGKLSRFIAEARRRRVFRTAGLYIVGAWVLLQVADLALESIGLPDSLLRFFWIAAFAGFPVALIFGWFFDVTVDGISRTLPSDGAPAEDLRMRVPDYVIVGALAVVVAVFAAGLFDQARQAKMYEGPYDPNGIAVLPLENLSGNEDQEYFSAGMHDALITSLSKISGFRVVSRTTTVRLDRALPMTEIGKTLGVRNIVEGSVTRDGDRVRVIVQLIDAATDAHIWAENFEREFTSVLGLQGDMAKAIARAVNVQLSDEEDALLSETREIDPKAYDRYLRGAYLLNHGSNRVRRRGITILEKLIDDGHEDAQIYASLAFGYALLGHSPYPEGMYPASKLAARKAMELDDSIPEVYLALGMHEMYYEWDFAAAENHLLHALELNPSQIDAVYHYAWLMEYFRNTDKSLPAGELTVELDPLLPDMSAWLAEQYRYAGQYERAVELAENALELDPKNALALMSLGTTYAQTGDYELALRMTSKISNHAVWGFMHAVVLAESGRSEEARDILESIDKIPRNVISLVLVNSALGEVDEAFHWMEVARESKLPWYPWFITMAPFMDEVRADPRMRIYAEELGVEDILDDVLASF
jgi:TolB-like protein